MNTLIINIGDELLIGQVVNTNASWMGEELNKNGFNVSEVDIISDIQDEIENALKAGLSKADVVLITGGLGPTKDDVTKKTLAKFFDTYLVENEEMLQNIEKMFRNRGFQMTPTNREQALVPASCTPILNHWGTAPGMWFEKDGKIVVSMPGVPFEMQPMMREYVIPELKKYFKTEAIIHKTVLTQGIGESFLSDLIEEWELALPENIRLAYLPNAGMVLLRLSGRGQDRDVLESRMREELEKLQLIAGKYIVGVDEDSVLKVIANLLAGRNETLATAESCTGGFIAHSITSLPGSSKYFKGGIIAYDNEVKENLLKVSHETLQTYGAVSEQTAREMAKGALNVIGTTYALSTTGIAGPDGGSAEKPVGMVCIAVASEERIFSATLQSSGGRIQVIQRATFAVLSELYRFITQS